MIGVIIGAISAVGAALTAAVSTAGPALMSMAANMKTLILGGGSLGLSDVLFIVKSIMKIAKILGIINDETPSEELGAKAILAEMQPEDFEDTQKYIEYLKDEVDLDKDKLKNKSEEEILVYKVLGSGIALKGVEESIGVTFSPIFLEAASKSNLSSNEILNIAKVCGNSGMTTTLMVDGYMENKISLEERMSIGDIIIDGLKEVNPSMDLNTLEDKLVEMELKYDRG